MKEIGRLRLKFILYNMLIVTAVIGVTFGALVSVVRQKGDRESGLALERGLSGGEEELLAEPGSSVRIPYFSVLVEPDGRVVTKAGYDPFFPDAEFRERMALLGMQAEEADGVLSGYHLRFLRREQPEGHLLVFVDTSYGDSLRSGILRHGGLACAGIWIVFLGLSCLFSGWAVKPVRDSVRQQKRFIADASHELKTPLTVITADAALLAQRCSGLSEETDRWLSHINQECAAMKKLVESLLLLAKGDACAEGKRARERLDLSGLVTEKALVFDPLFFQEGKQLETRVEEGIFVMGEGGQLAQLIQALLDNAVKYGAEGGLTEVRLERCGKKAARIWVNSQGPEIPKEKRALLFQRFYRGDPARETDGSFGLGLAIAGEAARRHGGKMGVEYKDGMNCFYAVLPLAR